MFFMARTETDMERKLEELVTEAQTQTLSAGTDPRRKNITGDTVQRRIVVVSPYAQLNAYLESTIPNLRKGILVDIVVRAEQRDPPYLDVPAREKPAPKRQWIIDDDFWLTDEPYMIYAAEHSLEALAQMRRRVLNYQPVYKKIVPRIKELLK